jgi:hypothetical protein
LHLKKALSFSERASPIAPDWETDMELFQIIFRSTIQSIVIGVWSLILLALLVGSVTRTIGFAWRLSQQVMMIAPARRLLHPARTLVPIRNDDEVIDAEWVHDI